MIGWLRSLWRRSDPLYVDQVKAWGLSDPQMPSLVLPAIKPLKAKKVIRLHEVPKWRQESAK